MSDLLYIIATLLTLLQVSCANVKKTEAVAVVPIETPRVMDSRENQVIVHKGYTVSYNKDTRLPNWVAYELTDIEVNGTCKRNSRFFPDPDAKGKQADNEDYRNTGWDKGHIAPAGDMKWDDQAMLESCYFTNICPQNHNLNGGDWRTLEEKCRDYARRYGNVYIAAGPIKGEKLETIWLWFLMLSIKCCWFAKTANMKALAFTLRMSPDTNLCRYIQRPSMRLKR